MLNIPKECSRLSNVLTSVLTETSLQQIKDGIINLVLDKNSMPKVKTDPVHAFLFFSERDKSIICKSTKDVFSYSKFYKDGSRKVDNFIYLSKFDIKKFLGNHNLELDLSIDSWLKGSFAQSVTEELFELQKSIDLNCLPFNTESIAPPMDLFNDQQLKNLFFNKIFSDLFVFKDSKERYTLSQETIKRLFKIKDEIISEMLDDLKNHKNGRSYQFFLQFIMRLKKINYINNKSFYSLLNTVFIEDMNVWGDIDYFISGSRFYDEHKMLTNFKVHSMEELQSLIELLKLSAKSFFLKDQIVFFSSCDFLKGLMNAIKNSRYLPEDFELFGEMKKDLSMDVLSSYYYAEI